MPKFEFQNKIIMSRIAESELIINNRGAIYHLDYVFRNLELRKIKSERYKSNGAEEVTINFQVSEYVKDELKPLRDEYVLKYLEETKNFIFKT